jgi:hypothetical protein
MLKTPDAPKDGIIPQHILDALAQIRPAADRRATCISRIEMAFHNVRRAKEKKEPTPARRREQYRTAAKALRALEAALTDEVLILWPPDFPHEKEIRRHRKFFEWLSKALLVPAKSGRRGDKARNVAVREAHNLLVSFGNIPTLTSGGAWHVLAELLYGNPDADLFQNIRDYDPSRYEGEEIPY